MSTRHSKRGALRNMLSKFKRGTRPVISKADLSRVDTDWSHLPEVSLVVADLDLSNIVTAEMNLNGLDLSKPIVADFDMSNIVVADLDLSNIVAVGMDDTTV